MNSRINRLIRFRRVLRGTALRGTLIKIRWVAFPAGTTEKEIQSAATRSGTLDCKAFSAFLSAAGNDRAALLGLHAFPEAVRLESFSIGFIF